MRSALLHSGITALAFVLAVIGFLVCDDLGSRVAIAAGAVGVGVVLMDLYRYPSRVEKPADKLSP